MNCSTIFRRRWPFATKVEVPEHSASLLINQYWQGCYIFLSPSSRRSRRISHSICIAFSLAFLLLLYPTRTRETFSMFFPMPTRFHNFLGIEIATVLLFSFLIYLPQGEPNSFGNIHEAKRGLDFDYDFKRGQMRNVRQQLVLIFIITIYGLKTAFVSDSR